MPTRWPYLMLITAAVFWGGNFVAGRAALNELPPFTLALLRWIAALLVLLPFAWGDLKRHGRDCLQRHASAIVGMGFLGIAGFTAVVYVAIEHTTAINAAILSSWSPMMIVIVSFFVLGERVSVGQLAGFVLSFVGVMWIVSKGSLATLAHFRFNPGDVLMLAANLIWAFYSIIVRKSASQMPALVNFTLTIATGLVFLLPAAGWELSVREVHLFRADVLLEVLYLGLFASVVAFLCWNMAVRELGPSKASPFLNLVPLFATLFAVAFLGEKVQVAQAAGGMFILAGVYLSFRTGRRLAHSGNRQPSTVREAELNA